MTITTGDTLPEATLLRSGSDGPQEVALSSLTKGRKVVIFALPGAFSGTCSTAHMPSFIRNRDAFAAKGVDEIICIAVNDPFVLSAWDEATGAGKAGVTLLADAGAEFTRAVGMDFSAPAVGLISRSKRYAMLVEDGKVAILQAEENPGVCDVSGGEALLASM
ncbi:peroxiredoxin [Natronohydrobacter thiooxidans]|uniref:peroxiredoxin n=1 Tax=Natronohydrobacter thiooxidans TaxID=87172 RepID=UPI0008FF1CF9|nr:peroxiredoxin [Natronohydrobacter thiooxidans]